MITTTLNRIRTGPCPDGWEKLLKGLGKTRADDEPLPFAKIVEINGLDDAIWCCRAEPQYAKEWRLFAVWCARRVQHLMKDQRSINAIDVAERYASDEATDEELTTARTAAYAAAWAANVAAWAASRTAADAAALEVAALEVAALEVAARDTEWAAEREAQKAEFLRIVTETEERAAR